MGNILGCCEPDCEPIRHCNEYVCDCNKCRYPYQRDYGYYYPRQTNDSYYAKPPPYNPEYTE